jgi:hypothetical protein
MARAALIAILIACESPAPPPAEEEATFPLEVIGVCPEEGVCAETRVELALDRVPSSAALVLTTHNLVDDDMAQVLVNGTPVDLSELASPLLRRHGGVASGRIEIDPASLVAGENELVFQYTRQVRSVSGYRVLALAIEADGASTPLVLDDTDPASWRPFDDSSAAIERGRAYFQDESRDGGPTCATCHVDSGADLEYFAFSSHSIVERAKHHLFPEADARDIASFLRASGVERTGRIFEPPFQPGETNHGAAGAGHAAVAGDDAFGRAVFGDAGIADELAWDFAASIDLYRLPAPVQAPPWFRWLPRDLPDVYLDWEVGGDRDTVRAAMTALRDEPTNENAWHLMSTAVAAGREIFALESDPVGRADLLRLAAVKLFEWSRQQDFDGPMHGFPDRTPPYPYEIGFAIFESPDSFPGGYEEVMEWWWVQLSLDAGRGFSDGRRPLDYRDVLLAAEGAGLGPNAIVFLHLLGSYEESRGELAMRFGESVGPARLLEVPMRHADARTKSVLLRRFFRREAEWIAGGGELSADHHAQISRAWEVACADLEDSEALRALAPIEIASDLATCPE